MDQKTSILAIIFASVVFVFLLNASPVAKLGIGVQLPFGWHYATVQKSSNCTLEELNSPDGDDCAHGCSNAKSVADGLPFVVSRNNQFDECQNDSNTAATILNYVVGVAIGVSAILLIDRRWQQPTKQSDELSH